MTASFSVWGVAWRVALIVGVVGLVVGLVLVTNKHEADCEAWAHKMGGRRAYMGNGDCWAVLPDSTLRYRY